MRNNVRNFFYRIVRYIFNTKFGKSLDVAIQRYPLLKEIQHRIFVLFNTVTDKKSFVTITLPSGIVMELPTFGSYASMELQTQGVYEEEETKLIQKHLKEGDTFLEIGANIGYFTLFCSRIVGNSGRIYALEPNPVLQNLIKRNCERNNIENVTILPYAAGDREDKISLDDNTFLDMKKTTLKPGEIHMKPIDTILMNEEITEVAVATLDIEGAEIMAVDGMQELLNGRKIRHMLVEVNLETLQVFNKTPRDLLEKLQTWFTISLVAEPEKQVDIDTLVSMAQDASYINVWCSRR